VSGVQGAQLLDDEEQEDDHGPARVLEVLQSLPQAYRTQRDEISQFLTEATPELLLPLAPWRDSRSYDIGLSGQFYRLQQPAGSVETSSWSFGGRSKFGVGRD
jgi:hypothetical protein